MFESDEHAWADRLLQGMESGRISPTEAEILAQDLDPVYIYVIVTFLRAVYPATDPAATPVLERVVKLTRGDVVGKYKTGGQDPISKWFESEYEYAAYRGRGSEMLALVADKLES